MQDTASDLSWAEVRSQLEMEERLVNLPRLSLTIDAARQLLMRLRVMQNAINNGDNVDNEVRGRARLLGEQIMRFPANTLAQLTEAERDERRGIFDAEYREILNMDPMTITPQAREEYLTRWRAFGPLADAEHEETVSALHMWLGVALLRLHFLNDDALTGDEAMLLLNTRAFMIEEIHEALGGPAQPDAAGLRATLQVLELEAEAEEPPLDAATRTAAIMAIYRPVALESLPPNERNCTICGDPYGEAHDDKDACDPRLSPCCPPATVGDACILAWLIDGGTCPFHRGPMHRLIRAAAREL